jgi:L-ascorbate metabolism protein UlaG (beta-lactamase superfamily)
MPAKMNKTILLNLFFILIFSGCAQVTPVIQEQVAALTIMPPTSTVTITPIPTITNTPTQVPPKFTATPIPPLLFQPIPKQKILQDESFIAMNVYRFLPDPEFLADEMSWNVSESEKIVANISEGVVTANALDSEWYGSEMVQVEACDPTGRCGTQQITYTILDKKDYRDVSVFFLGNSGFLIVVGEQKVLIDAFFDGFPPGYTLPSYVQTALVNAEPPFDDVDMILATHEHADHFSETMIRQYMQNNPNAIFVSTTQAISHLGDLADRTIAMDPVSETPVAVEANGIQVEAIYLSHGNPGAGEEETYNNGYVITIGGIKVFHTGDINRIQDVRQYNLTNQQIDLAFIPHFFLGSNLFKDLMDKDLGAKYLFPIHYQYSVPEFDENLILDNYPDAVIFSIELENWIMPVAQE